MSVEISNVSERWERSCRIFVSVSNNWLAVLLSCMLYTVKQTMQKKIPRYRRNNQLFTHFALEKVFNFYRGNNSRKYDELSVSIINTEPSESPALFLTLSDVPSWLSPFWQAKLTVPCGFPLIEAHPALFRDEPPRSHTRKGAGITRSITVGEVDVLMGLANPWLRPAALLVGLGEREIRSKRERGGR
jgi:hypothetical protein